MKKLRLLLILAVLMFPGCLKAAGLTEADVMQGVAIANKGKKKLHLSLAEYSVLIISTLQPLNLWRVSR